MITNITLTKIDSKTYPSNLSAKCNIAINLTLQPPNIISQPTPFGDKDILKTDYIFSANYLNPSMGYIRIEGSVDYYNETNLLEIKNNWSNEKSNNVKNEISNVLFLNTIPFVMGICEKLKLPSPIAIPQINFNKPSEIIPQSPTGYV